MFSISVGKAEKNRKNKTQNSTTAGVNITGYFIFRQISIHPLLFTIKVLLIPYIKIVPSCLKTSSYSHVKKHLIIR